MRLRWLSCFTGHDDRKDAAFKHKAVGSSSLGHGAQLSSLGNGAQLSTLGLSKAASLSCLSSIDLHPADSYGTIPAVYLTGTQQHAAATAAAAALRPACASPSRWDASLSLFAGATDTDGLSGGGGLHPAMLAALPTADDLAALLEGSEGRGLDLFSRYDMDLDGALRQQDFYDLHLELGLALSADAYSTLIHEAFTAADVGGCGALGPMEWLAYYRLLAALGRGFLAQDAHGNGQLDEHDFTQLYSKLAASGSDMVLPAAVPGAGETTAAAAAGAAAGAFREADLGGRGILNFGQVLLWFCRTALRPSLAAARAARASSSGGSSWASCSGGGGCSGGGSSSRGVGGSSVLPQPAAGAVTTAPATQQQQLEQQQQRQEEEEG